VGGVVMELTRTGVPEAATVVVTVLVTAAWTVTVLVVAATVVVTVRPVAAAGPASASAASTGSAITSSTRSGVDQVRAPAEITAGALTRGPVDGCDRKRSGPVDGLPGRTQARKLQSFCPRKLIGVAAALAIAWASTFSMPVARTSETRMT